MLKYLETIKHYSNNNKKKYIRNKVNAILQKMADFNKWTYV